MYPGRQNALPMNCWSASAGGRRSAWRRAARARPRRGARGRRSRLGRGVKNKRKACRQVGFESHALTCPPAATRRRSTLIDRLQCRPGGGARHPVQLPLLAHIDATALINRIDPRKGRRRFHAVNVGALALRQRGLRTVHAQGGVMTAGAYRPAGARGACGRGGRVQPRRPTRWRWSAAGRLHHHDLPQFTRDLPSFVRQADIPVVAVGRAGLVKGERIQAGRRGRRRRHQPPDDGSLVGDVEFEAAAARRVDHARAGRVGRMTVATLIENTLEAAETFSTGPW